MRLETAGSMAPPVSASLTFEERRSHAFGDSGLHLRLASTMSEAVGLRDVKRGLRLELVCGDHPFGYLLVVGSAR